MNVRITPQDDHSHKHNGHEDWQESWALTYFDPATRVGGWHHTSLWPVRGVADCWSWFSLRGRVVRNYSRLELPLPTDDYTDMRLGPLHIRSLEPNLKRQIDVNDEHVTGSVVYAAYPFQKEPIVLRPSEKSGYFADVSSDGHYETVGAVTGKLQIGSESISVNAVAYDDRSWGLRAWNNQHHRFIWAVFGPDLCCALYNVNTNSGGSEFGWVYDGGNFHQVRSADFAVVMNNDGVTARAVEVDAWTETHGGYHLKGTMDAATVITHRRGFMASPAMGIFEMGGRIGVGHLEISELKRPTPALIEKYQLDIAKNDT